MKYKIILLCCLISFSCFVPPVYAQTFEQVDLCNFTWQTPSGVQCSSVSVLQTVCDSGTCPQFSRNDTECFERWFVNDFSDGISTVSSVKPGTLQITRTRYVNTQMMGRFPSWVLFNNRHKVGCGDDIAPSDELPCSGLYQYLFDRLSNKFPLDIFVPVYNFSSPETECPSVNLFGRTFDFCAPVMLARVVKYIVLIAFVISCVMSL